MGGGGEGDDDELEVMDDNEVKEDASDKFETGARVRERGASSSSTAATSPSSLASSTAIGLLSCPRACEPRRARFGPASLPYSSPPSSASIESLLSTKFLFGDLLALPVLASGCAYSGGYGAGDGEREERADKGGDGDGVLEPGRGKATGSASSFEETPLEGGLIDLGEVHDDDEVEGATTLSLTRLTLAFCACFDGGVASVSPTGAS